MDDDILLSFLQPMKKSRPEHIEKQLTALAQDQQTMAIQFPKHHVLHNPLPIPQLHPQAVRPKPRTTTNTMIAK